MTHDWGDWDLFDKFQFVRKTLSVKNIDCYYSDWLVKGGRCERWLPPRMRARSPT